MLADERAENERLRQIIKGSNGSIDNASDEPRDDAGLMCRGGDRVGAAR